MHSLALMTVVALTATIFNCKISAQTMTPPEEEPVVRLVNGAIASEGRLEVFQSGEWGTVCNNLWTLTQANVVCRQLGYLSADRVFYNGDKFGVGSGKIHLQNVLCEGTEDDLLACSAGVIVTPCEHTEDVGVACTATNSIRLSGGTRYGQGRLEMMSEEGVWGRVCAQDWGTEETYVACKQLGLQTGPGVAFVPSVSDDGPYVTGGLTCNVNEDRLDQCTQMEGWTPDSCNAGIVISCGPDLFQGPDGDILIWYGGVLGAICPGDDWNTNAASVACRYMGYKGAIQALISDQNVSPNEVIVNNPTCSGDETFYTECESAQWAYPGNCISADVGRAGVICERQEPEVRIQSESPYPEIGYVEISVAEPKEYMITCAQAWNINAAHVVCKKLGYELGAVEIFFAEGTTRSDKVITRLDCPETVSNLADCTIEIMDLESAEDCDLDQVAAVACSAPDNYVQLIGGSSTSEGVLEYKINGLPSLICDPDWSDTEAAVACRMRGYETGIKSEDEPWT